MGRLHRVIATLHGRLGSLRIRPLAARHGRAPHLAIIEARHGGRADLVMAPTLDLHEGAAHADDRPDYTSLVERILRGGEKLPITD